MKEKISRYTDKKYVKQEKKNLKMKMRNILVDGESMYYFQGLFGSVISKGMKSRKRMKGKRKE